MIQKHFKKALFITGLCLIGTSSILSSSAIIPPKEKPQYVALIDFSLHATAGKELSADAQKVL